MRRILLATVLLFLPLVEAQWIVTVSANPLGADLFVVADSNGCITAVEGEFTEIYELNNDGLQLVGPGSTVCVGDPTILELKGSVPLFARLPRAEVFTDAVFLSSVSHYDVGDWTVIHVRRNPIPLLILFVLAVAGIIWFGHIKDRGSGTERDVAVLEYVAKHPGCTQKDVAAALGFEKYQVSRILSRLEAEGKVVRVRRGISKRVYLPQQLQ